MALLSASIDDEVFLQGKFINIGVNSSGSLGTVASAPTGFFTDTPNEFSNLGLFADTDGFGVGEEPTFRDTTLPGTPVEGFSVGYSFGGEVVVLTNKERTGFAEITGVSDDISTASAARASWIGTTSENLQITQIMSISDNANYVRVDITLTNSGLETLTNLRYMRNVDPDQAPGFVTDNQIITQGPGGALVASYVPGGTFPFFYYSQDDRAIVSNYGFQNNDPYEPLAYDTPQPDGFTASGDTGVNITFSLGELIAGESEQFTFYMGVTDDLSEVLDSIVPDIETNVAPNAIDDSFSSMVNVAISGSVLLNDTDADLDPLTASVVTGPANGTLTLGDNGEFIYTPNTDFTGTDSFTYTASDGELSDTAVVSLVVNPAVDPGGLPNCPVVTRAGTQDGSPTSDQVLTGSVSANTFFVSVAADSGKDTISNFGKVDVFVTDSKLQDGNNDGFIGFGSNKLLDLDTGINGGNDTVAFTGLNPNVGLRYMGESCTGVFVYADASVRPKGAIESTLGDDILKGDVGDAKGQVFFFDTALQINLGSDQIQNFGSKDLFVTTTKIFDGNNDGRINFGTDKMLDLSGGGGDVTINGSSLSALEFDGSQTNNGVEYFVYSKVGSPMTGVDDLFVV